MLAGALNHVWVSVHNRGSDPAPAPTTVSLYVADATFGPPKFPSAAWGLVGTQTVAVPGREGTTPVLFEWVAPPDAPEHSCLIATLDSPQDPFPTLLAHDLSKLVRSNNNITWKNLHVVQGAILTVDLSRAGAGSREWRGGSSDLGEHLPHGVLGRTLGGSAPPPGTFVGLRQESAEVELVRACGSLGAPGGAKGSARLYAPDRQQRVRPPGRIFRRRRGACAHFQRARRA